MIERSVWRQHASLLAEGLLVVLACALAVLGCYPDFREALDTSLWTWSRDPYGGGDFGGTLFLVGRALVGEAGSHSTLLAWPEGFAFGASFANTVCTDLVALVVRGLGLPLGYNVAVLAILASNGLAVHLATRALGARAAASLGAGLVAAVLPLLMEEVLAGRPVSAWWAPGIAGFALSLLALGSWKRVLLHVPAVALLGLAAWNYGYHLVLLSPWMLVAGLVALLPLERGRLARAGVGLLLFLGILAWAWSRLSSETVASHLMPPPFQQQHLDLRHLFDLGSASDTLLRSPGTLAPAVLLGCLLALTSWRSWLPALLAALLLLAVSLGTNFYDPSSQAPVDTATPYVWIVGACKWLWGCPRATRYGMAGLLCLCIAGGAGWGRVSTMTRASRFAGLLAVPALLAVLVALPWGARVHAGLPWPPLPALDLLRSERVLLDLPLRMGDDNVALQLVGYVPVSRLNPPPSRVSAWRARLAVEQAPLLVALTQVEAGEAPSEALLSTLRVEIPEKRRGLRRIVIHNRRADFRQLIAWTELLESLGARRVHTDFYLTILELPLQLPPELPE